MSALVAAHAEYSEAIEAAAEQGSVDVCLRG